MTINPFYYSIGSRVRDDSFLKFLNPTKGDKIIDVGCGLGYFSDQFAKRGASCTGVDLDPKCISYCQQNMQGSYLIADVRHLPFPDNYFDKALCTEVIEHIENNEEILSEIRRVVKKNGTIVASVPCSEGIFKAFFKNIGHNSVDGNSREYHWHKGYSRKEFNNLLLSNGFTPTEHDYTLVAAIEAFMGLSKIVVRAITKKKIDSQANALLVEKTLLWKIYCKLFPIITWIAWAEKPLSKQLKGHMLIIKGECLK